jgi:phosphatidylinositol alpha-1,6-mannosyltransferase
MAESGLISGITVLPRCAPSSVSTPAKVLQLHPVMRRELYALKALQLVVTGHFDIIFCGHLYISPLAALLARLVRSKLIVQMHGIETWSAMQRLRRSAIEVADLVFCVSRHTRAMVLGEAGIAPERIAVLPNTVGSCFSPGDGSALRKDLGFLESKILLTVGRMDAREQYKGHDRVIAAMPHLVSRGYDVAYVIVGEGDDRYRLQALADEKGVATRVKFLGPAGMENLVDAYRMADVYVMPSTGEGFGIAFLEAMACGTPAIGLAVGGARDALADGELGAVVSEREFEETLCEWLRRPKTDPEKLASAVRTRFGRLAFAGRVDQLIKRLCSESEIHTVAA